MCTDQAPRAAGRPGAIADSEGQAGAKSRLAPPPVRRPDASSRARHLLVTALPSRQRDAHAASTKGPSRRVIGRERLQSLCGLDHGNGQQLVPEPGAHGVHLGFGGEVVSEGRELVFAGR